MTASRKPLLTKAEGALLSVAALLAAIVAWRFSTNRLNVVTGFALLAAVCAFAFFVTEAAMRLRVRSTEARHRARLLLGTTTFIVLALELFLRIGMPRLQTYQERVGNTEYVSVYDQRWFTATNAYPPNDSVVRHRSEFTHVRTTNSLGLVEREVPAGKPSGEFRVIALGDSYTEGMGAAYDSTWVNVAQRRLAALRGRQDVTFINGGTSGSDVHSAYMLLKDRLLQLEPDVVVVATNVSDVTDVQIRGGMKRFQPGGSLVLNEGPWWERFYAVSFLVRFWVRVVLHYNHVFVKRDRAGDAATLARGEIREAIDSIVALGAREGFATLVVLNPVNWELENDRWSYGFDKLSAALAHREDLVVLDLLAYYRSHALTDPNVATSLFWPVDGHYNAKGYRAMGEAVATTLHEYQLVGRR